MSSSKNIITVNDFSLLLGRLESFYSTQPTAFTSRATTVAGSPENTHAQLLTEHNDPQQQQQQQQQSSSQPTLFPFSPKPRVPPSTILPETAAVISTVSRPAATHDHQTSLDIRDVNHRVTLSQSLAYDFSRPDSPHSNTIDSQSDVSTEQPIQGVSFALTTAAATSITKNKTKLHQSPPLYTNAAEFIVNYTWHIPAPDKYSSKGGHPVHPTYLPHLPAAAPHTIRHRSVDPSPTEDHSGDYKQYRPSSKPKKEQEVFNGYNRHHGHLRSDPYTSVDLLPGPDDVRSAQITLERLRPLQDVPRRTSLTEEQKLELIEHGRAIGNRPHYYDNNNRGNNCSSNNNHHLRQRYNNTNVDTLLRGNEGGGRCYRSKITYSRDFLMTFSDFNVLPDNIDRIHWIQQNPTLEWSQKSAGPMMARPQGTLQDLHQGAGIYDPEMGCHLSRREGGFRRNGDVDADIGFRGRRGVGGEGGQGNGSGASRGEGGQGISSGEGVVGEVTSTEDSGFRREGEQGTSRGNRAFGVEERHGTFRGDSGLRGERGLGAPSFPLPPSPTLASSAPRSHVRRSSASTTGGLSGSVYSFKVREPLGPPAVTRRGFQMRGFWPRTTP